MKLKDLKPNCIYICVTNAKHGGFFSWLQRFVTGADATHSEPILHLDCYGDVVGLSAEHSCTLEYINRLIENKDIDVWIYEIEIKCNNEESLIKYVEEYLTREYFGKRYGYFQIIYFVIRRIAELFGIDARRWYNPFKAGLLCSEICYWYLLELAEGLSEHFVTALLQWKSNNIHSGDIKYLMNKYFGNVSYGLWIEE